MGEFETPTPNGFKVRKRMRPVTVLPERWNDEQCEKYIREHPGENVVRSGEPLPLVDLDGFFVG